MSLSLKMAIYKIAGEQLKEFDGDKDGYLDFSEAYNFYCKFVKKYDPAK